MRIKWKRLPLALALVSVLLVAFSVSALAAGPVKKKVTPNVTPKASYPCGQISMEPYDVGYGGGFSNSLGSYTEIEVTLYRRWDYVYDVWCDGFQTQAKFKVDHEQLTGLCTVPSGGVKGICGNIGTGGVIRSMGRPCMTVTSGTLAGGCRASPMPAMVHSPAGLGGLPPTEHKPKRVTTQCDRQ